MLLEKRGRIELPKFRRLLKIPLPVIGHLDTPLLSTLRFEETPMLSVWPVEDSLFDLKLSTLLFHWCKPILFLHVTVNTHLMLILCP